VFHLAAAQHEANVPDQHFWNVNVEGTRNMADASVEAGVRCFVHGSSIGVYGWTPGSHVNENSPLKPGNIYGVTKLAGEEVLRSYAGKLDFVILRISETYGPGDLRLLKLFKGVRTGRFPMIGPGNNLHHLIFIDDLIDALLLSADAENATGKTFVVAGDKPISTRDMVAVVAAKLGKTPPRLRVPLTPMLLVAKALETVLRPLGIQPPLHPRRMNFYRKSFAFSSNEAQSILGFHPRVGFENGAEATARWYEQQRLLG
jgi:nucleoside-diphosphate-sugar epimerase